MSRSITRRLAVLFASVSSGAFLVLGMYLAHAIEIHFKEIDRSELADTVARVVQASHSVKTPEDLALLHKRLDAMLVGHDQIAVWVARGNGERLMWDSAVPFPGRAGEQNMAQVERRAQRLFTWSDNGKLFRGMATHVPVAMDSEPPLRVWAALNIDYHDQFMALFERALWAAIAAAILLSAGLGVVIARSGMKPVHAMAAHARRISTTRLGERIDTRELPRELHDLADAFNDMFARLQDSFKRLSDFSSDIAHELRTPVSNLLTETQVMLSKARTAEAYHDVLASNAEELEHLSRMICDMLFLAKADNGLVIPRRERVDLAAEVRGLFDFYDALAEQKGLSLVLEGSAVANGDRLMLRRVINNLLSNAVRHTPDGGEVRVRLAHRANRTVVSLFNSGEPIPEAVLPALFERFYRADDSRRRYSEGAGLGLAISRSIITSHGGAIRAYSDPQGNTFEFWLPG